jgi:hypothetical protein
MEKAKMSALKLKIIASISILVVMLSTLSVSATGIVRACTYSPFDLNQDRIVDMKDVLIFAASWQATIGEASFNPRCDFNEDGIVDISDAALLAGNLTLSLKAHVFIAPRTLNLKCQGNWITCIILLPAKVNASDFELSSIKLNNTIPISSKAPVDRFSGGLVVKFSREAVITLIHGSLDSEASENCGKSVYVTLTVTGTLMSGVKFSGSDTIRVIHS